MAIYQSLSLNGTWRMAYAEGVYSGTELPAEEGFSIENAVPAYWEDMTEQFQNAPFFGLLRVNPEYGLQRYPMAGTAPDMALPNIIGTFFYSRKFLWEPTEDAVELYFGGVQNRVSVWLNGQYIGYHAGYSTPFSMPISGDLLLPGENTIVLSVSNDVLPGYNEEMVSGLTNRAANQYTGGVYDDVELRTYSSPLRDAAVLTSPDCKTAEVQITQVGSAEYTWEVLDGNDCILSGVCNGNFSFSTSGMAYWSPENPKLYTLRLVCGSLELLRTFGIRRLTVKGVNLELNGDPCYLRGICEHCYFPEMLHPSQDVLFYRDIIRNLKELGFNFIRFHTFVPNEAYMQAADELGILVEVESPTNTSLEEWAQIISFCRSHPSVVMYSCGNERMMDEPYIDHLRKCAHTVHSQTDSLFSPLSALRGLEYLFMEPARKPMLKDKPFPHDPERFRVVGEFTDLYNSYTRGLTSYTSLRADREVLDSWSCVYQKPRLSHEICIHGTYTNLDLKGRYTGTRVGATDMFSSLEKHLAAKGLLRRAPLYFRNSCQWQRRLRKHCFEATRLCSTIAGFDFLGPIDTHWHTFGYDVGMMNEFYELKPGETLRNVRMYNSATVLLADLGTDFTFTAGSTLSFDLFISHFGTKDLTDTYCTIRLMQDDRCAVSRRIPAGNVARGTVDKLLRVDLPLPESANPEAYRLYITLDCDTAFVENEWEIYTFPEVSLPDTQDLIVSDGMDAPALFQALEEGKDVLLLGGAPFVTLPTTFQMALAGRTQGNLATVIADHPLLRDFPHEGFCGWQFRRLLEEGQAVRFENQAVPFQPIIEVVSSHKFAIRQAALFEFSALNGRLLVCSLNLDPADPAANWLKSRLISYATSEEFKPDAYLNSQLLQLLIETDGQTAAENTNLAVNPNDKTTARKKA